MVSRDWLVEPGSRFPYGNEEKKKWGGRRRSASRRLQATEQAGEEKDCADGRYKGT